MANQQFSPDYVYNLIANNPQGRAFVENLARMNQLQQAAQQFAPQIQQFAQNPMQSMNQIGDWAQGAVNQMQQPVQQQQQPVQNNQQGGQQQMQNPMNPMNMAMDIIAEFRQSFKAVNDNLKEIYDQNDRNQKQMSDIMAKLEEKTVKKGGAKDVSGASSAEKSE